MKNLSAKMDYTGVITPQMKLQPPTLKDESWKHSFLVSSYSTVKHETLDPNILSTPMAIVLKH